LVVFFLHICSVNQTLINHENTKILHINFVISHWLIIMLLWQCWV
jgi:hypothetical protein